MTAPRAALVGGLLALLSAPLGNDAAAAEPRLRVLIVIDANDDPFAERIRAETSALGLEVVTVEPWRTGESIESLDAAGRANQAAAAIRMISSRKGVEIWVANQPTGRSLLRQLVVDERPGTPNEGLVALQTAELLRTTLLSRSDAPAPIAPAPRPAPPASPPQITAAPPRGPSLANLQVAGGVLFSPGGGDPAMQLWMTVSRLIVGPIGVALESSLPVRPGTLTGPEGSADISIWLAGAAIYTRWERPTTGLYWTAAVGAAALRLTAAGNASGQFVASTETTIAGAGYIRADGGFEVARWLRFGARAVAGAVPSGIAVRFAGNEAALWGRPFLAGLLLADFSWH